MFESSREIIFIFSSVIALVSLLVGFIIYFVLRYRKRQEEFEKEKQRLLLERENVIMKAQLEIGEQVMADIAGEIHDNIGASLSMAKLAIRGSAPENFPEIREHTLDVLTTAISDLRALSKNLHGKYIEETGLREALNRLVTHVNRAGKLTCELKIDAEVLHLGNGRDILLFRCIQEAVNNAVKHSGASLLRILVSADHTNLHVTIEDNGQGISPEKVESIGLRSMRERMEKSGGTFNLFSAPGNGCKIALWVPQNADIHVK